MKQKVKRKIVTVIALCAVVCGVLSGWAAFRESPVPTVTIVMSTYNRGTTMSPSIESMLAQTYTDFEFIIVNDGSTDDTALILESYAKRDPRIVVLTNETNKGLVYSLNRGIDAARGKYIARMDDDDYSLPFRLERQVLAMDVYPDITVLGGMVLSPERVISSIAKKNTKPEINDPQTVEMNCYFGSGVNHPTVLMRRDFLNEHHLRYRADYLHAEDAGLWKDIINAGGKITSLNEVVLIYRAIKLLPSPRPAQYGKIQRQSWVKVLREKWGRFFPVTQTELDSIDNPLQRCVLLKKMREANKIKKVINQQTIDTFFNKNCIENLEEALVVKHPYWEGLVTISGDRFDRLNKDTGKIIRREGDLITVKWARWDTEIYRKTDTGYQYVQDANGTVKQKNNF